MRVKTPNEWTEVERISGKKVAVCPILRAGVGMLDGVLSLISGARVGFIGLYRDEQTLQPVEYYVKLPQDIAERDVILLDPMLATGNSTAAAVELVERAGAQSVVVIALIAAPEGIERVHADHPEATIVVAAVDRGLNEHGFIVPGLGDAGDRLYGTDEGRMSRPPTQDRLARHHVGAASLRPVAAGLIAHGWNTAPCLTPSSTTRTSSGGSWWRSPSCSR